MKLIIDIIVKYNKALSYITISLCTAVLETIVGLLFINLLGVNEVISNTIGICVGTLLHYFLITGKVFDKHVGYKTILIYVLTFFIGMAIQDLVVGIASELLKNSFDINLSYVISKGCSLVMSFVLMYNVRKFLYSKVE